MTISGMLESSKLVRAHIQSMCDNDKFKALVDRVESQITELDLEPLEIPHLRRPPKRFCGPAATYGPAIVDEYFRVEYFKIIDAIVQ